MSPSHLFLFGISGLLFLSSCATTEIQVVPNPDTKRIFALKDLCEPRQIELCFDGTANNWQARTNVRRRFEMAAFVEDPGNPCLYIEGVGNHTLAGKIFALGMKQKVLKAYKFLARHWRPGGLPGHADQDKILIFGFSRGAFQARMLAGMMAHCGLPYVKDWENPHAAHSIDEKTLDEMAEDLWRYCRDHLSDPAFDKDGSQPSALAWSKKLKANQKRIRDEFSTKYPQFEFADPRIELLALWDTVPGLPFTELTEHGQPGEGEDGQRYKVSPYPNTRVIVHALALDEVRSRFKPLLVGPPVDSAKTKVFEAWFPGAHADVGGGYNDSNDMAGISYNWLHRIIRQEGISKKDSIVYSDPLSILHHPLDNPINGFGSKEQPRTLPLGAFIDRSVFRRADGEEHLEAGRGYVLYDTNNPVEKQDAAFSAAKAKSYPGGAKAYLRSLGLVYHDDTSPRENELKGQEALKVSEMISQEVSKDAGQTDAAAHP